MRPPLRLTALFASVTLGALLALASVASSHPRSSAAEAIAATFAPFAPKVKTRADATTFYVESNGMADHPMMVGITSWQQQVPIPQNYTGSNAWQFPLKPLPAKEPLSARNHFFRGAIAIAANGVPIFNALNNRGDDAYLAGELDKYGGHAGRGDDYHYHTAPLVLEKTVGKGKPIAYALDGYPLYGLTEPDGTPPSKLDAFNGHTTPALGYHYHATTTYPYINGGFHGEVVEREGQVDPQPHADPVRPGTPPLRGATITGFTQPKPGNYSLTYEIQGQTCKVNYRVEADGSYTFDYVAPSGDTQTRHYQRRSPGPQPPPDGPREGRRRAEPPAPKIVVPGPNDFQLNSSVVTNGGALPKDFTCDGESVSLPVSWKNAPAGTKAFALVMHHIPPGDERPHVYWIVYNIPASVQEIPRGDQQTGKRGVNTVNRRAVYTPPCSKGPGKKWYTLTLYALSAEVPVATDSEMDRDTLLQAIPSKTLGTAVLHVSYTRSER